MTQHLGSSGALREIPPLKVPLQTEEAALRQVHMPGAAKVLIAPSSPCTCNKNNTAMPLEREKANSSDVFSENRTFVSRT